MQSKYFKTVRLTDGGKQRFKVLSSMPQDARDALVDWIAQLDNMPRLYTPAIEKICAATNASAGVVADAVNISLDALSDFGKFEDPLDDFMADARAIDLLDGEEQYVTLREFFAKILPHAHRIHVLDRVSRTEDRGAPLLRHASVCAAIKPVFDRDFEYGKMKITEFEPCIVDYTTVVQVEMQVQNRTDTISFQLSEDTLDRFLTDLLAAQAEMKQAQAVIGKRLKEKAEGASC